MIYCWHACFLLFVPTIDCLIQHFVFSVQAIFGYMRLQHTHPSSAKHQDFTMVKTLREQIKKYAQAALALNKRELHEVRRLAQCIITYQKVSATKFLKQQASASKPVLVHYSSDGTPLQTRMAIHVTDTDFKFKRSTKRTNEFFVQRSFYINSEGTTKIVLERPLQMQDKTADSHFVASRKLWQLPSEHGHGSIQVIHQVYDRAVRSACNDRHRSFFRILMEEIAATDPDKAIAT